MEKEQLAAEERRLRVGAGEKEDDIREQEVLRKLTADAQAQLRRYSSISMSAQIPIMGLDARDTAWMEFKDGCRAICKRNI